MKRGGLSGKFIGATGDAKCYLPRISRSDKSFSQGVFDDSVSLFHAEVSGASRQYRAATSVPGASTLATRKTTTTRSMMVIIMGILMKIMIKNTHTWMTAVIEVPVARLDVSGPHGA